jgi:tRNA modification GTPase
MKGSVLMFDDDTIAAVSTPPGYGGISIIRISGSEAFNICARIFTRPGGKTFDQMPASSVCYGHIRDEKGQPLDDVLVSKLAAAHTYTTQDVAEINCHGGFAAVREVLRLVLRNGARIAQPGEFTKRAFLAGASTSFRRKPYPTSSPPRRKYAQKRPFHSLKALCPKQSTTSKTASFPC